MAAKKETRINPETNQKEIRRKGDTLWEVVE